VRFEGSVITGNEIALNAASVGQILSYQTNKISGARRASIASGSGGRLPTGPKRNGDNAHQSEVTNAHGLLNYSSGAQRIEKVPCMHPATLAPRSIAPLKSTSMTPIRRTSPGLCSARIPRRGFSGRLIFFDLFQIKPGAFGAPLPGVGLDRSVRPSNLTDRR
jgi:hypothetical protein